MNDHAPSPDVAAAAARLGTTLPTAFRRLKALRPEVPTPVAGLDHAALPLLFALSHGDSRVGALADACHADISTTSRYATALVRLGLVDKTPDPLDRRAQVLVITDAGREVVAALREQHLALFQEILSGWSADDIARFDHYLNRFAEDVEHHLRPQATDHRKED